MQLYVMITHTDCGIDVHGVYQTIDAAWDEMVKRFNEIYATNLADGITKSDYDEYQEPEQLDGYARAALWYSGGDFWEWIIQPATLQ